MQVLYERCAAIDIGKDVIAVAVRRRGGGPGHGQADIQDVLRGAAGGRTVAGLTGGHPRGDGGHPGFTACRSTMP